MITPEEAADALLDARSSKTAIPPFTKTCPDLSERWGYAVQDVDRARRLAEGEGAVGAKLGLTSEAKQRTMGIARPVVGFLTDRMLLGDPPSDLLDRLIQPRSEPEIAFRLRDDMGKALSFEESAHLVEAMTVAIEIIDSRYEGFRFLLPDVLADNTSAAGVVLGEWTPAGKFDELPEVACRLFVDAELRQEGRASAVLGHPIHSLVYLSEYLAERGDKLPAGSIVLSGAITDAVPLKKGSVHQVEMEGFAPLSISWS